MLVADVAKAVGYLLNDVGAERWTPMQLSVWVAECHIYLAAIAPAVCVERGPQPIVAGPKQALDTTVQSMARILGTCDANGVVADILTECSDTELFLEVPGWMAEPAGTPLHYAKASGDLRVFYLYPPNDTAAHVLMDFVRVPYRWEDLNWTTTPVVDDLAMFDNSFIPIFADYVLYRAFGADADNVANMQLSDNYFNMFMAKLAAVATAMGASDLSLPKKTPRKAAA